MVELQGFEPRPVRLQLSVLPVTPKLHIKVAPRYYCLRDQLASGQAL